MIIIAWSNLPNDVETGVCEIFLETNRDRNMNVCYSTVAGKRNL